MSFETIENLAPQKDYVGVPENGIAVTPRYIKIKKSGTIGRWIQVKIGRAIAQKMGLDGNNKTVSLKLGTGNDAGKIAIIKKIDGDFTGNLNRAGHFAFTINRSTAEGLFSLKFKKFERDNLEVNTQNDGSGNIVVFMATAAMLDADEDG